MKLKMDSGNFSALVEIEVNPDAKVQTTLIEAGLRYIGEREGLGAVYKELGGVEKNGKLTLPKGFVRTSVPFNEENAEQFADVLSAVFNKLGVAEVKVTQYVPPETEGGLKKATALFEAAKNTGKLESLAAHPTIGYEGDVKDADAFIAHIHKVKYAKVDANAELAKLGLE
jgi:hypothetical protein